MTPGDVAGRPLECVTTGFGLIWAISEGLAEQRRVFAGDAQERLAVVRAIVTLIITKVQGRGFNHRTIMG